MIYNVHFALGSFFFLALTIIFYMRQTRLRDMQNHLYTVMLFAGLTAVLFDFIAGAIEPICSSVPVWCIYAANSIFILSEHICLPAFFLYCIVASEKYHRFNKFIMFLAMIPFITVVVLLAISPLCEAGIFYVAEDHSYVHGSTHFVIYVVAAVYMVASSLTLAANFKTIPFKTLVLIMGFTISILLASVIQILFPEYLVTTAATALSLTGMYYILRSPDAQTDPLTGAFCRPILYTLLRDLKEKKHSYTIVLYSMLNCDDIAHSFGPEQSSKMPVALSSLLRHSFPDGLVFYMNTNDFAVVMYDTLSDEQINLLRQLAPSTLTVDNVELPVRFAMSALRSINQQTVEQTLNSVDYMLHLMKETAREGLFIADTAFQERIARSVLMESSFDQILREGQPELVLTPVFSAYAKTSAPVFYNAALLLHHEKLEGVSASEFFFTVKKSGNTLWYYERLFALIGARLPKIDASVRFCLPLFAAALLQDDMAARLSGLCTEAGIEPARIVFSFTESEMGDKLPVVTDNIRTLSSSGFGFRLDGFAHGYSDMSLLNTLPIGVIAISSSLLADARDNVRSMVLLGSVISVLQEIGKEVICMGVNSSADSAAARAAGAMLLQGDVYHG